MISFRKLTMVKALCLCVGVALGPVSTAFAQTFRVNTGDDVVDLEPGNGLCVSYLTILPPYVFVFCTLRAAIQEANGLPGKDVIELGSGTYRISLEGRGDDQALTGDFDITDSLDIIGAGADKTFIDADGLDRVLDIVTPGITVTLSGLSIINGELPEDVLPNENGGGGVRNQAALVLEQVTVRDNSVHGSSGEDSGGGIFNQGTCSISSSTIEGNSANEGGGIFNAQDGILSLNASTLSVNNALAGAGLSNDGTATLINTTISNNKADEAALLSGGGIINSGELEITQCTVAENSAPDGGGISNTGLLSMVNTLLAVNQGGNCRAGSEIISQGFNLDDNGTCEMSLLASDLHHLDPNLAPLSNNGGSTKTHAIYANSPARDKGKTLPLSTTDQRGRPRTQDGGYDIGAFEAAPPVIQFIATLLL